MKYLPVPNETKDLNLIRVNSFVPEGRAEHNAILVDKKLYFHGGWFWNGTVSRSPINVLFYLDTSIPFTISDKSLMPWIDHSSIIGAINRTGAPACIDMFKASIFFIGGDYSVNAITKFDTTIQQWSIPSISGPIPLSGSLKYVPCVSLGNEIYIYGGNTSISAMNKLNTLNLSWSILSYTISSSKTQGYSATLLNDLILYIGGTNKLQANHLI
ncbi:8272_t:CDS:2 [Racocetra fulgida]|uniref:8272_t:CDS:1 n=1 Tax=Racocetra fulgida TaxID=60492 RepID=A0A9N9CTG2_9GLOM|nr:8272_t:CDS:2 [Racocetra fulgida]